MARSLLTPERADRIVNGVATGNSVRASAGSAGIHVATFMEWLQRGRRERDRLTTLPDDTTDPNPEIAEREHRYVDLLERVEAARDSAEVQAVAVIRQALLGWDEETTTRESKQVLNKDGEVITLTRTSTVTVRKFDWRAAGWWLERTRPSEFGRYVKTEVTGVDGGPLVVSSDDLRARARQLVEDELASRREQRALVAPSTNGQQTVEGS